MGSIALETDPATDAFLLKLLGELSSQGKVALRDGRNGVIKHLIAKEKEAFITKAKDNQKWLEQIEKPKEEN